MTSRFKHFQTFSSGLSGSSDLVLLAICQLRRLNETIELVPSPGNPTRQRFPHHPPRGTWSMHGESGRLFWKCSFAQMEYVYTYMYSIAFFQPIYQNTVKIPCVFVFFKIIPGEQRLQSSKVESKETPNHQSRKSFWVIQSCLFWLSMQLLPELRSVQHTNCDSTARKLKLTIPRMTSLEESESQSKNTQLQEPSKGRQWAKTLEIRWSEMSETCKTRAKSKLLRCHLMHPNWNCTPWPTGDATKCNMLHFRMIGWNVAHTVHVRSDIEEHVWPIKTKKKSSVFFSGAILTYLSRTFMFSTGLGGASHGACTHYPLSHGP